MAKPQITEPGEPIHLGEFFLEDRRFPAVYFLYHHGEVVYVGQTTTLKSRIDTHLSEGVKTFDAVGFIRCTIDRLLEIEAKFIRSLAPKYNECSVAKKMRERESWAREQNREQSRIVEPMMYHIDAAANCGVTDDEGECLVRPKEFGKFFMISDQDAEKLLGDVKEPVPLMQMLYWAAGNRDLQAAQKRFEEL